MTAFPDPSADPIPQMDRHVGIISARGINHRREYCAPAGTEASRARDAILASARADLGADAYPVAWQKGNDCPIRASDADGSAAP